MHPSRRRRRVDSQAPGSHDPGVSRDEAGFDVALDERPASRPLEFNVETRVIPVFDDAVEPETVTLPGLQESHEIIKKCLAGEVVNTSLISYIADTYPDIAQCRPEDVSALALSLLRSRPGVNRYVYCDCSHLADVDRGSDEWLYYVQSLNKGENLLISRVQWFNGRPYHDPLSITESEIERVSQKYTEVIDFTKNPVEFFRDKIKKRSTRRL